ncbi:hypothetical protein [uncultured Desulfuromusa sp.]|uniref:hypothetical protein n=1 Tax=uncultured Desulfuromusa sp. TaxID=219183 RepID=UPI002AA7BE35|nr:hypothetical protein [uncultured Desulfuromusa sp.]
MPQTEMWSIIVSIMVTLFIFAVILGVRLVTVSQRLRVADHEIDQLMQKLNLPEEDLLQFQETVNASKKQEIAFKQLNSRIDVLMNEGSE